MWLNFYIKGRSYAEQREQRAVGRPTECVLGQAVECYSTVRKSNDTMMRPMWAV